MNKKNKVLIGVLIVVIALFVGLSISVALFGKKIVESQIERNIKMKASLGSINLGFPLSIALKNLEVGDLLNADRISFSPNILGFLAGKIVLQGLTITNPVINLEQSRDGKLNLPRLEQKEKQPPVFLTGLVIRDGKLIFTDKKINPQGCKIIVDMINLRISKVIFPPASLNTKFNLSAFFVNPNGTVLGTAETKGWIDFGHKDMDGTIQIKDLEITYFAPYYGNFISSKKLLSAKVNFSSELKAKNNDLEAKCHFQLSNLVYAQEEPKETELPTLDLLKNALDLFIDQEGKLNLDFVINTKLDKPAITTSGLEKIILEAAAKNIARQSPEEVYKKVSDTVEQFKKIGEELKDIFKKKE